MMWVLIQASLRSNMKPDDILLHLHFSKITTANPLSFQMLCSSSLPSFNSLTVTYLRCNRSHYACSRVYENTCLHSYFTEMNESCVAVPCAVGCITVSVAMQAEWQTSFSPLTYKQFRITSSQKMMYRCSTKIILHVQAHVGTCIRIKSWNYFTFYLNGDKIHVSKLT